MSAEKSEIPLVQGDTVVPYRRGNIDLTVQFPVPLGSVCLENKGPQAILLHWVSMYWRITSVDTVPVVAQK